MTYKMKMHWFSCIYQLSLSLEAKMPTFSLQCGPNADPNIRKVRNADPMPPLRTFLAALHHSNRVRSGMMNLGFQSANANLPCTCKSSASQAGVKDVNHADVLQTV